MIAVKTHTFNIRTFSLKRYVIFNLVGHRFICSFKANGKYNQLPDNTRGPCSNRFFGKYWHIKGNYICRVEIE